MAGSETTTEQEQLQAASSPAPRPSGRLLVSLTSMPSESLELMLAHIARALPDTAVHVMLPDASNAGVREHGHLTLSPYTPQVSSGSGWTLTAADFLNLHELLQRDGAEACLLLGPESQSLSPESIHALASAALGRTDLVAGRYTLRPREGLINSGILYPVSRALYGARPRFPLALDLGLSRRMVDRLATAAQRFTAIGQNDAVLWPVAEAAVAGYSLSQVDVGHRTFPQPGPADLNSILALITGSLFADVEAKAAFWQRSRTTQPDTPLEDLARDEPATDIQPMLESFRLAYTNLREIWSLVLPPQTLLGLKKLSAAPSESFRMPESLWARTVYDFMLAFRLRTLNRGHLLGALTPLYLAWVASHLNLLQAGTPAERHAGETAAAFEAEKPYLVSRWRWPDRFNP